MRTPHIMVPLLWVVLMTVFRHGSAVEEKKIVIHVPTTVKHIHHHHTNKVMMKGKGHHQAYSMGHGTGGLHLMKELEHAKPMHEWLTGHVGIPGGHEEIIMGKPHTGGHGSWRESKASDISVGSRSIGNSMKHLAFAGPSSFGLLGRNPLSLRGVEKIKDSGSWGAGIKHVQPPLTKEVMSFVPSKGESFSSPGGAISFTSTGNGEKFEVDHKVEIPKIPHKIEIPQKFEIPHKIEIPQKFEIPQKIEIPQKFEIPQTFEMPQYITEEQFLSLTKPSAGRYEVKEEVEDYKMPDGNIFLTVDSPTGPGNDWRAIQSEEVEVKQPQYSSKPPVSSYEVKGHKGNSYSSVVIHNPKNKRQTSESAHQKFPSRVRSVASFPRTRTLSKP